MHYKTQLQWLLTMAKLPGWKAHAWRRAQELDADKSGLFMGISAELERAMTGQAPSSESERRTHAKPR